MQKIWLRSFQIVHSLYAEHRRWTISDFRFLNTEAWLLCEATAGKKVTENKGIAIGFIKQLKWIVIPSQWGF